MASPRCRIAGQRARPERPACRRHPVTPMCRGQRHQRQGTAQRCQSDHQILQPCNGACRIYQSAREGIESSMPRRAPPPQWAAEIGHRIVVRRSGNATIRKLVWRLYQKALCLSQRHNSSHCSQCRPACICPRHREVARLYREEVYRLEPHMYTDEKMTASEGWAKETTTDS